MQTPASIYEPSPRPYPSRVPDVEYPDTMQVLTVKSHGHFRWKKHDVFLTEVLWGEPIGLLEIQDGIFTVYFAHLPLACFDSHRLKVRPLRIIPFQTAARRPRWATQQSPSTHTREVNDHEFSQA